jgi:periplasmic glucans biosynthesis protein
MVQVFHRPLSRRAFLGGVAAAAALFSSTALTPALLAAPPVAGPFDFDSFSARMKELAASEHQPPELLSSEFYKGLDYDGYRRVQFDVRKARWREDDHGYQVHAFPMGWLFQEPVAAYEIVDGTAQPFEWSSDDFDFHFESSEQQAATEAPFPGIAGFRLNYPLNRPEVADELVSFLGASYFRALGRGNIYGLSARGLLINSWREGPEEFPRYSEFYLERPTESGPLTLYAALESPSVTGAYRFVIDPASADRQETVMEVTARLYFRSDIPELGIAPLTSMFLFAETNRASFDDYRPQVHDSDGLFFEAADGTRSWRPLNNTTTLGNSFFWDTNVKAFGLYQRDRDFETYQDAGAHYERRPSLRVEPAGDWGEGLVRLIEIPSRLEADDNIAAFFIPATPVVAGDEREFSYRLSWGNLSPDPEEPLAYVSSTRAGQGGVSGVANTLSLRKFVVDFMGGELGGMEPGTEFDIEATASAGTIQSTTFSRVESNGAWRLVLDVETAGQSLIELKAAISLEGRPLTETWLYQWRGETT